MQDFQKRAPVLELDHPDRRLVPARAIRPRAAPMSILCTMARPTPRRFTLSIAVAALGLSSCISTSTATPSEEAPPGAVTLEPLRATVRIDGTPAVLGNTPQLVLDAAVSSQLEAMESCYQQGLATDPTLAGDLAIAFAITEEGTVIGVDLLDSTVDSVEVISCITELVRALKVDGAQGPGDTAALYSLAFSTEPAPAEEPPPLEEERVETEPSEEAPGHRLRWRQRD